MRHAPVESGIDVDICTTEDRNYLRDNLLKTPDLLEEYRSNPTKFVCGTKQKKDHKYIVAGHYYYTPPHPDHVDDKDNFNMVREPVSRCQSRFYYGVGRGELPEMEFSNCMRTGMCLLPEPSTIEGYESMGYGELVKAQKAAKKKQLEAKGFKGEVVGSLLVLAEECSSNHQTRIMCGMQDICYKGTKQQVIEEAKRVAAEQYEVIGTTDRIPETLWVLNNVYPSFFGALRNWNYYTAPCSHCPSVFSAPRPPLQKKDEDVLKELNSLDTELIDFVHDLLTMKHVACAKALGSS
jgi:hypothetical protein